jgi:hypothetical protein
VRTRAVLCQGGVRAETHGPGAASAICLQHADPVPKPCCEGKRACADAAACSLRSATTVQSALRRWRGPGTYRRTLARRMHAGLLWHDRAWLNASRVVAA